MENNAQDDVSLDLLLDPSNASKPEPNKPEDEGGKGGDPNDGGSPDNPNNSADNNDGNSDDNNNDAPEVKVRDLFVSLAKNDDLSEEDQSLKDRLLGKYKGASFNQHGDIIDESNEIIKKFDDIYKEISEEDEVKLDKDGNQIDEEGQIVKTKAELDADKSAVNKIHQQIDYEFKDENGNIKTYEDSDQGLIELASDIAEAKALEAQSAFLSQNPVLTEVAKHLLAGKDLSTFNQEVDYSKVDKANLSKDSKIGYIRKSFQIKGFTPERIEASISRIEDGNQIDQELDFALEDLDKHQTNEKAQRQADFDAVEAQEAKELEAYWNDVQATINKGELRELEVPKEERAKFFDYLTKPVKNGLSQASIDRKGETTQDVLTLEFLRYKGYKLGDLVKSKANTQRVKGLKDLIARSAKLKPENFSSKGKTSGNETPDVISLDDIM